MSFVILFQIFGDTTGNGRDGVLGIWLGPILVVLGVSGEMYAQYHAALVTSEYQTEMDSENAKLNNEAEKLKTANLELEKTMLPRRLPIETSPGSNGLRSIQNFAGTNVAVIAVPDVEAIRLAKDIAGLLGSSSWKGPFIVEPPVPGSDIPDGVQIWSETNGDLNSSTEKAVLALSLVLSEEYLETGMSPSTAIDNRINSFPPKPHWWPSDLSAMTDTVYVFVGMKPIEEQIGNAHLLETLPESARKRFERTQPYTQLPLMTK